MFDLSSGEQQFVLIMLLALLPLVPAVITYRISPDQPIRSDGRYGGLTFKAGGAFAAYTIVFAMLFLPIQRFQNLLIEQSGAECAPVRVSSWKVRAPVFPVNYDGQAVSLPKNTVDEMKITMRPSLHSPSGREVSISLPGEPMDWPKEVYVNFPPDYVGLLELNEANYTLDRENGVVNYEHVVVVRKQSNQGASGVHDRDYTVSGSLNDMAATAPATTPGASPQG